MSKNNKSSEVGTAQATHPSSLSTSLSANSLLRSLHTAHRLVQEKLFMTLDMRYFFASFYFFTFFAFTLLNN
jgi:hypothetical protein